MFPFYRKGYVNSKCDTKTITFDVSAYGLTSEMSQGSNICDTPSNCVNQASTTNTIMYPSTGVTSDKDVELYYLAEYLCTIAHMSDISGLDHSTWRNVVVNTHLTPNGDITPPCVVTSVNNITGFVGPTLLPPHGVSLASTNFRPTDLYPLKPNAFDKNKVVVNVHRNSIDNSLINKQQ